MDKIDLDAIYTKIMGGNTSTTYPSRVKDMMKEAIHQALVLASEKAITDGIPTDICGTWEITGVNKQSILDVENLIV